MFLYTSAIFTSNYGIMSSYVDSKGSFIGSSVRGRKKELSTLASFMSFKEIFWCGFC